MPEPVVALLSPGAMGAAVGGRLAASGVTVITPGGRSPASEARARAAGLQIVEEAELAAADFVFSIVPPSQALATAGRIAALPRRSNHALFVDWNAISPATTIEVGEIISRAGLHYADGSIIGLPGKPDEPGPLLVASGPDAARLGVLSERGLRLKLIDKPVGAASALKMGYAGLTKGLMALGAAMFLAAKRNGCDQALIEELAASQPGMLKGFERSIPDMFGKAERFAPELREIAAFIGHERVESGIYEKIAAFYEVLAADYAGERAEIGVLSGLFPPR